MTMFISASLLLIALAAFSYWCVYTLSSRSVIVPVDRWQDERFPAD